MKLNHKIAVLKSRIRLVILMMLILFLNQVSYAQSTPIDFLRSTGKIYSVVAVICVIFLGIIFYLIRLERKLTKIENQTNYESKTT